MCVGRTSARITWWKRSAITSAGSVGSGAPAPRCGADPVSARVSAGRKRLVLLGSTGSIGEQTLDVVSEFANRYEVTAMAAGRNVEKLAEQVRRFRPGLVSVADEEDAAELRTRLDGADVEIVTGAEGLTAVATHPADMVVSGLVGAVGLAPTLAAIRAGRDIALANKEVMVMAGALILREVKAHEVRLLPVDSEHSAIFQALAGQRAADVERIILTASGGPFRTWDDARIAQATVEEALNHPNWNMGPKISIDSASLMNKGLEVIEARWLFDVTPEQVDVIVHPQSIVHSLVEYRDGSVLAQLGLPDMRVPIAVALAHPERLPLDLPRLDLAALARLDFEAPDRKRFPCLQLAFDALAADEAAPAVLNAANEVAVEAFLDGRIRFPAIAATNGAVLEAHIERGLVSELQSLDDVLAADAWAREVAAGVVAAEAGRAA
ncbi:MAG: 1-deoxy-D-xylulose-5-phosphate reductoisomerase [Deltaproteobacteria bacterium]|nr:MAG: 1-deoxy-D-xylulose-5-phosphate reductoisomerase [Deltaproteobacteria bacterium]TDJ21720.1 MAG: 1-deoxy-D-xylulose-5-phosphate reductoisomerase [Deltaproteobacteria bacterium]